MKNALRKLGICMALGGTLYGCSDNVRYRVVEHLNRPEIRCEKDALFFYRSIDENILTRDEAEYVTQFQKKSRGEQKRFMYDPLIEQFLFLNREKPSIRDIIFLYYVEKEIGNSVHFLRFQRNR